MAQSARFRRVRFGFNTLLLLSAASSAVLLIGGCDTESGQKDKEVGAALDAAMIKMSGSDTDHQTANAALSSAARETTDSQREQLRAKAMLGDSELQLAQDLDAQILANDSQIDRLLREITLLGNQIQSNNLMVDALNNREPSKSLDAAKQNSAAVTGTDADSDWIKSDAAALKSITAADAQVKDLTAKAKALDTQIKSDSDKRNDLLGEADKLTQQSQHEVKQKSVDLYVQGAEKRREAADLTVDIDSNTSKLAAYQADIGVWQGQSDAAAAAVKAIDEQSTGFGTDWKAVQATQVQLNADSKKILGDGDPVSATEADPKTGDLNLKGDRTLTVRSFAIADPAKGLARKNRDLRDLAESHLNNAIGKYGEAATLARNIRQTLSDLEGKADQNKPDREPWKQEQDALDPGSYQLLEGEAQLQKAEFKARSAAEARSRSNMIARLKPVLTEAKLPIYPSLDDGDGKIAQQLKDDQTEAEKAFGAAKDLFENMNSQVPEVLNGARSHSIFTEYGWSLLEAAAGDAKAANEHLGLAKEDAKTATADGILLPPLPPDLISAPAAPAGGAATPGRTPVAPPAGR